MGSNPTSSARSLRKHLIFLRKIDMEFPSHTFSPNSSIMRSTIVRVRIKRGRDVATTPYPATSLDWGRVIILPDEP